jgi:hypothetical protein
MREYAADRIELVRAPALLLRGASLFDVSRDCFDDDLVDLVLRKTGPLRGLHDQQQVLLLCFLRSPRHRPSLFVAVSFPQGTDRGRGAAVRVL